MNVHLVLEYLKYQPFTWIGQQHFYGNTKFSGQVNFEGSNVVNLDLPIAIEPSIIYKENIDAFKPITANGYQANSNNLAHVNKIIGFTLEQQNENFTGKIRTNGEIYNENWNFQKGDKIFLNNNDISTIPPITGFIQQLGVFKDEKTFLIQIKPAIII